MLLIVQNSNSFGITCSSFTLFISLSRASFKSSPATSGLKILLAHPLGSQDLFLLRCFSTASSFSNVHGLDLVFSASWTRSSQSYSLSILRLVYFSSIGHFSRTFLYWSMASFFLTPFADVTRLPSWSSIAIVGS